MSQRVYVDPRLFDKRVRVEHKVVTKGASGGMVTSWELAGRRWARISGKAGMKRGATTVGGGDVPEATHMISMYFMAGVSPTTHRIVHGGTIYEVLHTDNVMEQGVRLDMLCKSGVSRG